MRAVCGGALPARILSGCLCLCRSMPCTHARAHTRIHAYTRTYTDADTGAGTQTLSRSHRTLSGGRYFYARRVEPRRIYPVLQTRLLREVELSLTAADALRTHGLDVCQVHCDSNTAPGCKSTEHTRMLTGYIQSMGCTHFRKCLQAQQSPGQRALLRPFSSARLWVRTARPSCVARCLPVRYHSCRRSCDAFVPDRDRAALSGAPCVAPCYSLALADAYLVKPHAWATFVADRHSRDPTRKRGRRAPIFQP